MHLYIFESLWKDKSFGEVIDLQSTEVSFHASLRHDVYCSFAFKSCQVLGIFGLFYHLKETNVSFYFLFDAARVTIEQSLKFPELESSLAFASETL
jgi:hypothetical protein